MEDSSNRTFFPTGKPTMYTPDAGAAAVASAHAPFIYFDAATVSGINAGGVCHITLEAIRHMSSTTSGEPVKDFVVVGHLRMDLNSLGRLKAAIEQIEMIVTQPGPGVARN